MPTVISGTTGVSQVQDGIITSNKIADGAIADVDINTSAAIIGSKLAANTITAAQLSAGAVAQSFGNTSGAFNFRNKIINGGFDIWQRGTSFSSPGGVFPATERYTADRFLIGAGQPSTAIRSTDVPPGFRYSIEFANTNADFCNLYQIIESANSYSLANKTVSVSFWGKNVSGSSPFVVRLNTLGAVDNRINTTINAAFWEREISPLNPSNNWTYYTVTGIPVPASATNGLLVLIYRNSASSSSSRITGIQVEEGPVATPFEQRPIGLELSLCQRYYQELLLSAGAAYSTGGASARARSAVNYSVAMRANPTIDLGIIDNTNNVLSEDIGVPSRTGLQYEVTQGAAAGNFARTRRDVFASAEL